MRILFWMLTEEMLIINLEALSLLARTYTCIPTNKYMFNIGITYRILLQMHIKAKKVYLTKTFLLDA